MSATDYITIVPRISTCYFSEAGNNGLNVLDQADFKNQILHWQDDSRYLQKLCMDDQVTILVHTKTSPLYPPMLHLCTKDIDLAGNPTLISAINLNVAPAYKGTQVVAGNADTDPFTGITNHLDTSMWNFSFGQFAGLGLPGEGYYYLRLTAFNLTGYPRYYYSEPIYLTKAAYPNTQLYQCRYTANRSGNTNVVVSGWYDDHPYNTIPFTPTFATRCESYILPLDPKAVNIGYLRQQYEQLQITGQQLPMRTLKVGELCEGIPDYMLQTITEFLLSDSFWINSYPYIVYNPSPQSTPGDLWKSKRDDNTPLLRASTVLTTRYLAQQAMRYPLSSV